MDTDDHVIVGPPSPTLSGYTGYLLKRAFVRAQSFGSKAMPPGRHPRELGLLMALETAGPMSQRRLGEMLSVNRTVMVKVTDKLELSGLLRRERDPADRRNYALRVTEAGRAAIVAMLRSAREGDAEFTANLTEAERDRLIELLQAIVPDLGIEFSPQLAGLGGFLIARAHLGMWAEAHAGLTELGMSPPHVVLLASLATIEPCSQQALATSIGITGPAIVRTIYDLAERGLISRERNPTDRREHLLCLTPEGRTAMESGRAVLDRAHHSIVERLGQEGMEELNGLLVKLTS